MAEPIRIRVGGEAALSAQLRSAQKIGVSVAVGGGHGYALPVATEETLGGVKVGDALTITEDGVLSVVRADTAEQDNTLPITSAAVYAEIGNIAVLLSTI